MRGSHDRHFTGQPSHTLAPASICRMGLNMHYLPLTEVIDIGMSFLRRKLKIRAGFKKMQERKYAIFIHPSLFFSFISSDLLPTHHHSRNSKYITSIFF
jgi:hypothetical protein